MGVDMTDYMGGMTFWVQFRDARWYGERRDSVVSAMKGNDWGTDPWHSGSVIGVFVDP